VKTGLVFVYIVTFLSLATVAKADAEAAAKKLRTGLYACVAYDNNGYISHPYWGHEQRTLAKAQSSALDSCRLSSSYTLTCQVGSCWTEVH
jgi:hypothetical protein